MLNKISGLCGAIATVLAIVSAFVQIPGLDVNLALMALGLVAGVTMPDEGVPRMGLATLALPVAGTSLGTLPMVGTQVAAILGAFGMAAAGAFGAAVTVRAVMRAIESVKGLAS